VLGVLVNKAVGVRVVGGAVGEAVGIDVVGGAVGEAVGVDVVGVLVGNSDGGGVGLTVRAGITTAVGEKVEPGVGLNAHSTQPLHEQMHLDWCHERQACIAADRPSHLGVGDGVGSSVGSSVGERVGDGVGSGVGERVGDCVGSGVGLNASRQSPLTRQSCLQSG
jgi:hypothetical protein